MVICQDMWYPPKQRNRKLHIYIPDDYETSQERYPVMYFFDGHNLFFDEYATYGKSWGLKEFLDQWDKKMIIVGMECGHEGDERLAEYFPYHVRRGEMRKYEPLGDATFQWLLHDIKPMIDREFRTYPFRECTGIGGSSMGGIMALYGIVHYNEWFSKGACLSSAFVLCMPELTNDMKINVVNPDTRVFLSWGTKEAPGVKDVWKMDFSSYTYRRNKAVANKLMEQGALPYLYCQVGGEHCEADWERQAPIFMNFLWK